MPQPSIRKCINDDGHWLKKAMKQERNHTIMVS